MDLWKNSLEMGGCCCYSYPEVTDAGNGGPWEWRP